LSAKFELWSTLSDPTDETDVMRFPRVRFTVRRMMAAVAIVAIPLAVEAWITRFALSRRSDVGFFDEYILWMLLQLPLAALCGCEALILIVAYELRQRLRRSRGKRNSATSEL
jgi:hypothetical protein